MIRYLKAMIAAKRLVTLGGKIEGEIPVLRVWNEGELVKLALPIGPDTLPAGLQSMFWDSREGHSLVFPVEESSSSERIYSVQRNFGKQVNKGDKVWLSGWTGEVPQDFNLKDVYEVSLSNGTLAYRMDAGSKWVVHVHGRNASRAETLRNFKAIHQTGFTQLSISLESDLKPSGLGTRRSALATIEWKEVETAIRYAYGQGAEQVVLFGFSLGAMIIGECLRRSSLGQSVAAVVFDSPLIDFESTLELQALKAGQPKGFANYCLSQMVTSRLFRVFGLGIPYLPTLIRNLGRPALIFYSDVDGYVSMEKIPLLQALNKSGVFVRFPGGRHCRLYNQEPERYTNELVKFLKQF